MRDRIKIAIEFLKDKKSFTVGDLRLGVNKSADIEVTGWSQYTNFRNLTKENSLEELQEIKSLFYDMLKISPELVNFIKGKDIVFNLYFDDYGKASIEICSEKDGNIWWKVDIP